MRPLDEQLRGLIDGGVDPVTADEAQRRAADRSTGRTRPRLGLVRNTRVRVPLTVGVVLAVVVAAVLVLDGSSTTHQIETPGTTDGTLPASIIATRGDDIIELSSDGKTERVLATGPVPTAEGNSIAISPDGKAALVTGIGQPRRCPEPSTSIGVGLTRLDLTTNATADVTLAPGAVAPIDATFSPDATKYAYVEYQCEPPDPPGLSSRRPNALVLRDASGEEVRRFTLPLVSPDDGHHLEIIAIAGWQPDGRHLLVQVQHEPTAELWTVDTETPSGVLTGTKLPTPEDILAISVTPLGSSGRWAAVLWPLESGRAEPTQIVEYDPANAAIVRVLFTWTDRPLDESPGTIAAIDATGRHLLLFVYLNGGPTVMYRWSEGDDQPTKLTDGISAAAWIPTVAGVAQPTTTTSQTGVGSDPGDGNRQLSPKVVVAQGIHNGVAWELVAYESDSGLCVDLRIGPSAGGSCGQGVPPRAFGVGYTSGAGFGGSWLHGTVRPDVARVRVELTNGEVLKLTPIDSPDFDVNFFVTPLASDTEATRILALDASGKTIFEEPALRPPNASG